MPGSFDQQYFALLASRIRAQDADAFAEFYDATHAMLRRRIHGFLRDPDSVQDAMQEVYIAVYKNIGALKLDRLLVPWTLQIAYHVCCDFAQAARADQEYASELPETAGGLADEPYRLAKDRDSWERVRASLAKLPFQQRQAFLLRYENGLKLDEVAAFMGVSLATAKRYIAAARGTLQKDLSYLRP